MVSKLQLTPSDLILEPSAGEGAFIDEILQTNPSAQIHAYANLSIVTLEKCDRQSALKNTFHVIEGFQSTQEFHLLSKGVQEYPDHWKVYSFQQGDILSNECARIILADDSTKALLTTSATTLQDVALNEIVGNIYAS